MVASGTVKPGSEALCAPTDPTCSPDIITTEANAFGDARLLYGKPERETLRGGRFARPLSNYLKTLVLGYHRRCSTKRRRA